jgi:CDP-6-deoxy-D-xylo-4-hexulose-3-dehydrase
MTDFMKDDIKNLIKKHGLPPYIYLNDKSFNPKKDTVYYSGPYWDEEEVSASIETILTGKWLVAGKDVRLFETEFANSIGDKYGLMVNSGSSANLLMVAALKEFYKWESGSEVILSSVGFPTTLSVISQNNLSPVFVDVEFDTLNFDLDLIEEKITNKTIAVFLSPPLGNPPDIDRLVNICSFYNLILILDGCDSLGSKWNKKHLSEYAISTSESLYSAHIISSMQGGVITSKNEQVISIARKMATWGRACTCSSSGNLLTNGMCGRRFSKWLSPKYEGVVDHRYIFDSSQAYNMLPLELQGSIALKQLRKIDEIYQKRKYNYNIISNLFLKYIEGIRIPSVLKEADPLWFGVGIICDNVRIKQKIVSYLENNRIQTRHLFAGNFLLHPSFSYLDDYKKYPNANQVLDRVFFVGCAPHYEENILVYIKKVLKDFDNDK